MHIVFWYTIHTAFCHGGHAQNVLVAALFCGRGTIKKMKAQAADRPFQGISYCISHTVTVTEYKIKFLVPVCGLFVLIIAITTFLR